MVTSSTGTNTPLPVRHLDAHADAQNDTAARTARRPSRKCLVRALRAGAVNARRPRGTRGRSAAKSIDGAEHSGMLKGVMAAAHIGVRTDGTSASLLVVRTWSWSRPDPVPRWRSDHHADRGHEGGACPPTILSPRAPTATRKPWCERPHLFRRGATPRARRRGRSHHGLLTISDAVAF